VDGHTGGTRTEGSVRPGAGHEGPNSPFAGFCEMDRADPWINRACRRSSEKWPSSLGERRQGVGVMGFSGEWQRRVGKLE